MFLPNNLLNVKMAFSVRPDDAVMLEKNARSNTITYNVK